MKVEAKLDIRYNLLTIFEAIFPHLIQIVKELLFTFNLFLTQWFHTCAWLLCYFLTRINYCRLVLHSRWLMLACVVLASNCLALVFTHVTFVLFRVGICVLEYPGSIIWYFKPFSDAKLFMTCNYHWVTVGCDND